MPAPADDVFMDRALALAARGMALASPNPMVGAVLVREDESLARVFTPMTEFGTRKSSRWTQRATQRGARPPMSLLSHAVTQAAPTPAPRR